MTLVLFQLLHFLAAASVLLVVSLLGVVSVMRSNFNSSSKPKLACEIAADRVLAGRVSERGDMVETVRRRRISPRAAWFPTCWKRICASARASSTPFGKRWAA